jgi:hypothetical protein
MVEVHPRLWVASQSGCIRIELEGRAYVHACKVPCHSRAVGYRGTLPVTHPEYLSQHVGNHLYLNMIDPPQPLFRRESFAAFREFAAPQWAAGNTLVIHCNQGESRAPSLALLLLAKDIRAIAGGSYEAAVAEFTKLYPSYRPGRGIATFLNRNWSSL